MYSAPAARCSSSRAIASSAVGRMMAGVAAVVAAREVPRPAPVQAQQLLVAPADDEDGRVWRDGIDHLPDAPARPAPCSDRFGGARRVATAPATSPRTGRGSPRARGRTRRLRRASRTRSRRSDARRRRPRRAGGSRPRGPAASSRRPRAGRSRSARRAARSARTATRRIATQNIVRVGISNASPGVLSRARLGEADELVPGPVVGVDLGLVAGSVRGRADHPDPRAPRGGRAAVRASRRTRRCRR